ncbi:MAG: hypothetical protein K9M75_11510 [Phycisphaerae bacterium]|nr:hypothetical protein [Phycisphaerae bacterium]
MKKLNKYKSFAIYILLLALLSWGSFKVYSFFETEKQVELLKSEAAADNFPEYLKPPEGAYDLEYSSGPKGSYVLAYKFKEELPSRKFIQNINSTINSNGWFRTKYSVMNPQTQVRNSWVKEDFVPKGVTLRTWIQEWLNDKDECLTLAISDTSSSPDPDKRLDMFIVLCYYKNDSDMQSVISRYKKIHPEEFTEKSDNPTQAETVELKE